ncbi:PREDICTED: autophagy protein 5 isoform X1 [Rhagoletis zephyria]|uniref:autophagy protein 5 isoform X1 n=1 Tax=Rhagoletis zephyria TaxID=28612 RepID=UPI00081198B4|nr:PREDICTED: autophagy protein 5 isoform X1 [Rhagoletis zephyria]XP_017467156.1 PREDICTED: autophagy protein 5 isoform X1 [Rhagoletis zephyria]XP_036319898.1 autophagy protein 5 isoform X1 [Rhagoletis pomonella]
MSHDREILRLIWEGQIPICFQADSEEIVGLQQPENFYLMVSRLSYLPLVTDKVKKYFSRYISHEQDRNVWFDYNGIPLKLHYPIGVLYDQLHPDEDGVPWNLTIHFSKFPEDLLVKMSTRELLESHFMSCLKEADVLKHRGQIISSMQKKDHNQLWQGLGNDKFDQFWAINRRLMEPNGEQETFKYIPVRFYSEEDAYVQKLITPLNKNGQKKTLGEMITELSSPLKKVVEVRTHGISIHDEAHLQWLSEHLSYPDNFLHLFLVYDSNP